MRVDLLALANELFMLLIRHCVAWRGTQHSQIHDEERIMHGRVPYIVDIVTIATKIE
jgi:hypothetical protein